MQQVATVPCAGFGIDFSLLGKEPLEFVIFE
jgi:hypothetical protein